MPLLSNLRLLFHPRALLALAAAGFAYYARWSPLVGWSGFAVCFCAYLVSLFAQTLFPGFARKRWLERASIDPIILAPPFEDRWYVAAGGPDRRHNHHVSVSDQYFAYDFLRDGGEAWDQPILAPCDGMIVHVENRQPDAPPKEARRERNKPFGNYVSIQTRRGYVILAHLKAGSVSVRVGDRVRAGDVIGRCGNSGNTRGAHLHLHAQDQPSQNVDIANGVPVAFTDRLRSEPLLLEYGDRIG
ncbi:MAG TPA: M23 family metallopeptidase [Candidatus Aquilonibacter sp.]|nr:M23 family metallopeptidase [Candidatus Aquilonibacter sp.]